MENDDDVCAMCAVAEKSARLRIVLVRTTTAASSLLSQTMNS